MRVIPNNITVSEGRFFIDVAEHGCGNGCKYCYISDPAGPQVVIGYEKFIKSLNYILKHPDFKPGRNGSIITLSPNTEPLKSIESKRLVKEVFRYFLKNGNHIQIATKEIVDEDILNYIRNARLYTEQVIVYITITTITNQMIIEPYTSSIDRRLGNFLLLKKHAVLSCLYIKPIIQATIDDIDKFGEVVTKYCPDLICVGFMTQKETTDDKGFDVLYRNDKHFYNLLTLGANKDIKNFSNYLASKSTGLVFNTSVCIWAFLNNSFPVPYIWRQFPELCMECRSCEQDYINVNG